MFSKILGVAVAVGSIIGKIVSQITAVKELGFKLFDEEKSDDKIK